jgi:hypothetical protein
MAARSDEAFRQLSSTLLNLFQWYPVKAYQQVFSLRNYQASLSRLRNLNGWFQETEDAGREAARHLHDSQRSRRFYLQPDPPIVVAERKPVAEPIPPFAVTAMCRLHRDQCEYRGKTAGTNCRVCKAQESAVPIIGSLRPFNQQVCDCGRRHNANRACAFTGSPSSRVSASATQSAVEHTRRDEGEITIAIVFHVRARLFSITANSDGQVTARRHVTRRLGHQLRRLSRDGNSRQLKDSCLLALRQECEQNDLTIRKFQGIVMCGPVVLVDLPEDRGLVADHIYYPGPHTGTLNFISEGQLRP